MSFNMNLRGSTGAGMPSQTGNIIPKGYSYGQLNQYTPQQQDLSNQQFWRVAPGSYLERLASGDQSQFDEMEAPAMRQFQELQGNIASRFSQGGARRSSGFQNTQNQASQDFASKLQSQRMDYRNQALQQLMEMSNTLLGQRPYEQFMLKKSQPFWQQLALGTMSAGAQAAAHAGSAAMFA